ncbi:ribonuclease P protein component [Patescibacteria group bacterium]|nr:ribonuclease P protein component [Patescibacteria group bacterium]
MLLRKNRLKRKRDFDVVFKKGKGFKNGFLFLKIVENKLGISRFGFIVGKKLSKKATIRNKVRRRIAELARLRQKNLKPGIDVVFVAFPGLEKKNYWEIEEIVNKLFVKAKIFKP